MCLVRAKEFSRFVECGVISQYNDANPKGLKAISQVVAMRIRMQGFIVYDHKDKWAQAREDLGKWLTEGKIKKSETIIKGGLPKAEQALIDLYRGINTGKLMVEIKNHNETPSKL